MILFGWESLLLVIKYATSCSVSTKTVLLPGYVSNCRTILINCPMSLASLSIDAMCLAPLIVLTTIALPHTLFFFVCNKVEMLI